MLLDTITGQHAIFLLLATYVKFSKIWGFPGRHLKTSL